jgi:HEXXH motif-containing protein
LIARQTETARHPWLLVIDDISPTLPLDIGGALSNRLTAPLNDLAADLQSHDLSVLIPEMVPDAGAVIDAAANLISMVPSLELVVRRCVHEIFLLQAPNDSIDLSHSEPRWPTRIFLSLPFSSAARELRVAEAMLHEAMHLNLTFLEQRVELVKRSELMYSPWRAEQRPASGVLHGLYVFTCIHCFLEQISNTATFAGSPLHHLQQRLSEIKEDVYSIDRTSLARCLTPEGASLANGFFGNFDI